MPEPLILASGSAIRRTMLDNAGVAVTTVKPPVDEDAAKAAFRADGASPRDQTDWLAELKALRVSQSRSGFVIGADQMLTLDGEAYDKVATLDQARDRLRLLRGKTHHLICACVLVKDGAAIWRRIETASLTMRPFTDAFLDDYLARHGAAALSSVGCYQYEGAGAQLFSRVIGDYFAILGLPLLPLLDALRQNRVISE